jgi:hypothetical protein
MTIMFCNFKYYYYLHKAILVSCENFKNAAYNFPFLIEYNKDFSVIDYF